jgi:hypothetical protein
MQKHTHATHQVEDKHQAVEGRGVLAEVRAVLPDRRGLRVLADDLAVGTGVLVRRGWAWVTAEDWRTALTRLGYAAGGVYVGAYALHTPAAAPIVPWVGPGLVTAWCVAAWVVAPGWPRRLRLDQADTGADTADTGADTADTGADTAGTAGEAAGESVPSPGPETLLALVRMAAEGRAGAHLADILAAGYREHLLPAEWDDAALRGALEDAGVPIEQVNRKLPGGRQRTRLGVKVARAEAALSTGALDPVGEGTAVGPSTAPTGVPTRPRQGPPVTGARERAERAA